MVLWQRLATCRRGYRDPQSATVFPGILPFRYTCKSIALLKLRNFSQKRSLQQSHFRGRKHIGFLDSKKWSSPVSIMVHSQCLGHANHACHIKRRDNIGMFNGSCERYSCSPKAVFTLVCCCISCESLVRGCTVY